MMRTLAPAFALSLVCAGCTVGDLSDPDTGDDIGEGGGEGGEGEGGGNAGADAGVVASTSLSVDQNSIATLLNSTSDVVVTVSSDNYAGTVFLSLAGAPESWQVTFQPAQLTFTGSGTLQSNLSIVIPSDGEAQQAQLTVTGDSDVDSVSATVTFDVENAVEIGIADQTGAGGNHAFPAELAINSGTMVRFTNYDTTIGHTIHASGGDDFPHQQGQMQAAPSSGTAGGSYDVMPQNAGNYDFYCHDHGQNTGIGLVSVAP